MQIGQTTEEEGVESEIQKRAHCKSKEIESQAVLGKKVSNIKTFLPRGDVGGWRKTSAVQKLLRKL